MKQFELPKPLSQLFNVLKSHIFACELFSVGCSKQFNKTHNFRKIVLVTSSLQNSIQQENSFYSSLERITRLQTHGNAMSTKMAACPQGVILTNAPNQSRTLADLSCQNITNQNKRYLHPLPLPSPFFKPFPSPSLAAAFCSPRTGTPAMQANPNPKTNPYMKYQGYGNWKKPRRGCGFRLILGSYQEIRTFIQ